jgi:hypothetical protein
MEDPTSNLFMLCIVHPQNPQAFALHAYAYVHRKDFRGDTVDFDFLRMGIEIQGEMVDGQQIIKRAKLEYPPIHINWQLTVDEFFGKKAFIKPEIDQSTQWRLIWIHVPKDGREENRIILPTLQVPQNLTGGGQ